MLINPRSLAGGEVAGEMKVGPNDGSAFVEAAPKDGSASDSVAATTVRFSISQVSFEWDDTYDSLLELAEDQNIDISGGCRYGDCGTCLTELLEGTVAYNHATGVRPDAGYCLPCSCRPLTSITLKA